MRRKLVKLEDGNLIEDRRNGNNNKVNWTQIGILVGIFTTIFIFTTSTYNSKYIELNAKMQSIETTVNEIKVQVGQIQNDLKWIQKKYDNSTSP